MEPFEQVGDEFGTVRSRHRVDNERRRVTGFWALAIGAVATVLGTYLVVITDPGGSVTETQISSVSDTGYLFLGIGLLVCFVGLITSVSLFVSSRPARRRPA